MTEQSNSKIKANQIKVTQKRKEEIREALLGGKKFTVPESLKEDGYEYRYPTDDNPNRIKQLETLGYQLVLDKNQKPVTIYAGTDKRGTEHHHHLMKITKENKAIIEQIKAESIYETTKSIVTNPEGLSPEELYVKKDSGNLKSAMSQNEFGIKEL